MKSVVRLGQAGSVYSEGEIVERNVFYTFNRRSEWHDAGRASGINETLRSQARANTADGSAGMVGEAHNAEMKFVQRGRSKVLLAPMLNSCARPSVMALNPGTLAPPWPVGYGLLSE